MLRRFLAAVPALLFVLATVPSARAATTVVNVSRRGTSQSEAAVAASPLDANDVVIASNVQRGYGISLGVSHDGGLTWKRSIIARRRPVRTGLLRPDDLVGCVRQPLPRVVGVHERSLSQDRAGVAEHRCRRHVVATGRDRPAPARARGANIPAAARWHQRARRRGRAWRLHRPAHHRHGAPRAVGRLEPGRADAGRGRSHPGAGRRRRLQAGAGHPGHAQLHVRGHRGRPGWCGGQRLSEGSAPCVAGDLGPAVHDRCRRPQARRFGPGRVAAHTNVSLFEPIKPQRSRTVDAEAGLAWILTGPDRGRLVLLLHRREARSER